MEREGRNKMNNMQKVIRYKCKWCGKEFKTPDRHLCRWDPGCRNCLSCKHRGKYVGGEPVCAETGEYTPNSFECNAGLDGTGWNDFPVAASAHPQYSAKGDEIRCPDHELIEGYEGKSTFARIESERRKEMHERRSD